MLIKNYNRNDDCQIIENIIDLRIGQATYNKQFPENKPDQLLMDATFGPSNGHELVISVPFEWFQPQKDYDSVGPIETVDFYCKVIDYRKKGEEFWRRLLVDNRAYVCNDEGRTVQKVESSYQTPSMLVNDGINVKK